MSVYQRIIWWFSPGELIIGLIEEIRPSPPLRVQAPEGWVTPVTSDVGGWSLFQHPEAFSTVRGPQRISKQVTPTPHGKYVFANDFFSWEKLRSSESQGYQDNLSTCDMFMFMYFAFYESSVRRMECVLVSFGWSIDWISTGRITPLTALTAVCKIWSLLPSGRSSL